MPAALRANRYIAKLGTAHAVFYISEYLLHSTAYRRLHLVHLPLNIAQGAIPAAFLVHEVFDPETFELLRESLAGVGTVGQQSLSLAAFVDKVRTWESWTLADVTS